MTGTVAIRIGESERELGNLAGWLRGEDDLRGRVTVTEKPIVTGQMGGVLDAVVVVVTSGTAASLCTSLFNWLGRRREVSKVSLKVKNEKTGEELSLDCGSATDATEMLDTVRAFLDGRR
jgi:hypothetical protein